MIKHTKFLGILLLILVPVVVLLVQNKHLFQSGQTAVAPKLSGPTNPMEALLQTPFEFYGIVLDLDGNPVPDVKVSASTVDNVVKSSPHKTVTDAAGRFMIESKGMSLHVEVSKLGYYRVERGGKITASSQGFDFGVDQGRGVHVSNPAVPAVFHLRKAGNPIPLDRLYGQALLPRDGRAITVSPSKTSPITLKVQCRTLEDETQPPDAPYDWKCQVLVEGGGIQEAKDEASFTAPEDGYAPFAVIDMPKSLAPKQWSSRAKKFYWLSFPDNTFGKIDFMMNARGEHFMVFQGFRNPTPKDRNLEPKLDQNRR